MATIIQRIKRAFQLLPNKVILEGIPNGQIVIESTLRKKMVRIRCGGVELDVDASVLKASIDAMTT